MRLADVKWKETTAGRNITFVKCGKKVYRMYDWGQQLYTAYREDNDAMAINRANAIEISCWLADKEPCEPPR